MYGNDINIWYKCTYIRTQSSPSSMIPAPGAPLTTIYSNSGGARDYEIQGPVPSADNHARLFKAASNILHQRGLGRSVEILEKHPFEIYEATNAWNDEFNVLYRRAPLDEYEDLRMFLGDRGDQLALRAICMVMGELGISIRLIAAELDMDAGIDPVPSPDIEVDAEVVNRALKDAVLLVRDRDAVSGVDRVHTALDGYLIHLCREAGIQIEGADPSLNALFGELRRLHPALQPSGPRQEDVTKIYRGMALVIGALEPLRNRTSVAHPNEDLLGEAEAMLYINSVRTLLHFLRAKVDLANS